MILGRTQPKTAEIVGGRIPLTSAKDHSDDFCQSWRKTTYCATLLRLASKEMIRSGIVLKKQTRASQSQPISCWRARAESLMVKFFQI